MIDTPELPLGTANRFPGAAFDIEQILPLQLPACPGGWSNDQHTPGQASPTSTVTVPVPPQSAHCSPPADRPDP